MLFTSVEFVVLFLTTFVLFYVARSAAAQIWVLIAASLFFYAWENPALLGLLVASMAINALTSHGIAYTGSVLRRRIYAIAGVAINLAVLIAFKYNVLLGNLFSDLGDRGAFMTAFVSLPLPIGISFYTFEGISLLVDVFRARRGDVRFRGMPIGSIVDRNLLTHLRNTVLFVAFFPHLIAGPVLKAQTFFPQIGRKFLSNVRWEVAAGALIKGYFLKMVVADNMHDFTFWLSNPLFNAQSAITNLVIVFGYSIQIFADFAGYSLIAIGLAEALGYRLMQNFNFPYISASLAEFWRRWHISLSSWLRDYLYIPLGGNRTGPARTYLNLLIVMVLGGLWHGAGWSYAVWGLYHGIGLMAERATSDWRGAAMRPDHVKTLADVPRLLLVFAFVSFGWILFKLPNFGDVIALFQALRANLTMPPQLVLIVPILVLSIPVIVYHLRHWRDVPAPEENQVTHSGGDRLLYGAMLAGIVIMPGNSQSFIYFQF